MLFTIERWPNWNIGIQCICSIHFKATTFAGHNYTFQFPTKAIIFETLVVFLALSIFSVHHTKSNSWMFHVSFKLLYGRERIPLIAGIRNTWKTSRLWKMRNSRAKSKSTCIEPLRTNICYFWRESQVSRLYQVYMYTCTGSSECYSWTYIR